MLSLTRPQRQGLFTAAIVLGTIAPTLVVVAAAWRVNRPGHRHDVQAALGDRLGMKVTLEAVRYPRPGETVIDGIVLWHREPRRQSQLVEVARADQLRVVQHGRQLILKAEGLAVSAAGPRRAMEQVEELLSHASGAEWDQVALSAPSCAVELGESIHYELRDLAGSHRIENGSPVVDASYRVVTPDGFANRCELVLVRDRALEEPETRLTLRTGKESLPLPAQVLDPFFTSDLWLGHRAEVLGELTLAKRGSSDWEADFSGELHQIDLEALFDPSRVPDHVLTGLADLTIRSAHWGRSDGPGSRWTAVDGELRARNGKLSASLLRALRDEMDFRLADDLNLRYDDRYLPFDRLGLSFTIDEDGHVALSGTLGDAHAPRTILIDADRLEALAFAPARPVNLALLKRTLGPTDKRDVDLVPVSHELQFLDYLPLAGASTETGE